MFCAAVLFLSEWNDLKWPPLSGCGTQHPHRALGDTCVLLAAAPTTPPCFRHWRRSSSLLRIISGNIIYNFAILENLRIFQNCLFTGGAVTANGICGDAKGTAAPNGMQQSL